ncbi:MAG TPA: wax ester/triacylglycerol synthase family O-acyltransferase [Nocardioidaceae bacterium]|nr:wax ester/triacylglycerol synthase family O-acyltransferase [Nocardioidaceae bacterium]
MRQLSSLDAQFLAVEDGRTVGHVSVLGVYDAQTASGRLLDAALLRELITERLHLLPPFRWRLAAVPFDLDHPYWVDDAEIDLDYHVRELGLPTPGDDRQLAEQVARLISRPLDRAHPLWDLCVIHGLADGRVAVLIKMHHAAVDGMSGAELMSVLLDDTADGRTFPSTGRVEHESTPGQWEMLGRGLLGLCRQPVRAARVGARTLPHLDSVPTLRAVPGVKAMARSRGAVAPRTRFQQPISAHRRVAFGSVSLDEVKAVKTRFGCTVNDVVLALCASALRSWLDARDELPEQPLVVFVPTSVRTPEQLGTFGNRVSGMIAELPTDEPNPRERLRRVSTTMRAAKQRQQGVPDSVLQDANDLLPPALFAHASRLAGWVATHPGASSAVNVAISNVPGSPTTQYWVGSEQLAQYPISNVLDGIGLNFTVFSYRDQLSFGIVADRAQLDDAWPMIDGLRTALAELLGLPEDGS